MQTDYQQAYDAAKLQLLIRKDSVFLTTILFSLKFVWDSNILTACTNGRNLRVNPEFFLKLDKEERMFILAHEAYHVAFMHMARVAGRKFRLWNFACDYVINLMLKDAGFKVDPKKWLLDEKYRGMSSYEVYDLLDKKPDSIPPEFVDDMEEVEGDPAEVKEIIAEITDTISKASMRAKIENQGGTVPGEVEVFLDSLVKPKLPWHQIVGNILNGMNGDDYTFTKPNKWFLPKFYLPTQYSRSNGDIAVGLDISGSVTQDVLNCLVSEIYSLHTRMKPDTTHVVAFDTSIRNEYTIQQKADILKLKFKGGGGTQISPLYEWAKENKPKVLIIFTDGYFSLHEDEIPKDIPVFWIIYDNEYFKTKKGKVIHYVPSTEK